MKLPVIHGQGLNNNLPYPRRRGVKPEKNQLRVAPFYKDPVIHRHLGPFEQKIKLCARPHPQRDPGRIFPGRRYNGNGEDIRDICPQFH